MISTHIWRWRLVVAAMLAGGVWPAIDACGRCHAQDTAWPSTNQALPAWAVDARWYQVYVSRFRNGDPTNDPPHTRPWTADWLTDPDGSHPRREELFFRRYGGDLQGLRSSLPYLGDLGVNALYLNPVFAAPSEHKYDVADYRHIDDTFGVAGAMDRPTVAQASRLWPHRQNAGAAQWSASDRMFLDFLDEAHRAGMRVVLDGVFNHVGRRFWAFQDVMDRGADSPYASWFAITDFGPPLRWRGWDRPNGELVVLARHDDGLAPAVEAHLLAVTRRWMDPDGDGDPSDGIDGWRLDAAEQVPHGFWRRWRSLVKAINPDALIVGEIWTDPAAWLRGDEFDVVTNYPLAQAIVRFCRPGDGYRATEFAADLEALTGRFERWRTLGMINLLGSHDTARAVSLLARPGREYDLGGQDVQRAPADNAQPPASTAYARLRLAAVLQFTLPGAPMIYYGDEVGMYGGDDPYCRAPMWWAGDGAAGGNEGAETVAPHLVDLRGFYRYLLRLRREVKALQLGDFRVLLADDSRGVVVFRRRHEHEQVVVVVNSGQARQRVAVTVAPARGAVRFIEPGVGGAVRGRSGMIPADGRVEVTCPPLASRLVLLGK